MTTILDDIEKARAEIHEDGLTPSMVKMHPMTWRDLSDNHPRIFAAQPADSPFHLFGLLVETDPRIPPGRAVPYDSDGNLLVLVNGKWRTICDCLNPVDTTSGK